MFERSDGAQTPKGDVCLMKFPKSIQALRVPIGLSLVVLCSVAQTTQPTNFGGGGPGGGFGGPTDPGVQGGNRGTGAALVTPANDPGGYVAFFQDGQTRFKAVDAVANGLGPRFNSNSCASCHAHPAVGGSGAAVNPQFQFATNGVAPGNTIPDFITPNGPTREVRFPFFMTSGRGGFGFGGFAPPAVNGGVEPLFVVTGRPDAGTCRLQQPNFAAAEQANDVIFRIPTPTFGAGLIENLDDSTLLKNQAQNLNNQFGITGDFNNNGNDGTISRFGWKAQNKSLHIFAGEAYNVEMGISNLLFTQDRPTPEEEQNTGLPAGCLNLAGKGYPEDASNPEQAQAPAVMDDSSAFANFMRLLAPPKPGAVVLNGQHVSAQSITNGGQLFSAVGCAVCHNPTVGNTQQSNLVPTLSNTPVNAFSDIEIHHMGTGLADNVSQGSAGGDQFRTAPLWGLGQRIFFLHDGRTKDLMEAIKAHSSQGSEANQVIQNFNNLNNSQEQDLLNFLRSL